MKLELSEPSKSYVSGSQTARDITEAWVASTMFCPNCGHSKLNQFTANLPVADFFCSSCQDQFELKSQKKEFGNKVVDGAYLTKIQRLQSNTSPNLILLKYEAQAATVGSVVVVPKRFFVELIVERRKPLAPTARRAGWVGSNILIGLVPAAGRIQIVKDGVSRPREAILTEWQKTAFLDNQTQSAKGWLVDVMSCVDRLSANGFSLDDVYRFEAYLSGLYPENNNVRPKIRQQLQVLRDNGYLEFLGGGHYRLAR